MKHKPNCLRMADGGELMTRFARRQPNGTLRGDAGGEVPGKGGGDKVKALYEPGEMIVSNDMLRAEPGLREQLHTLRGNVLAAKGMTPEMADAKAMSGGTLRAQSGTTSGGGWEYDDPLKPKGVLNGQPQTAPGQGLSGNAAQRAGGATGDFGGGPAGAGGQPPVAGVQRGVLRTLTDQAFPITSTILRGRGQDAADAAAKGNWAGAIGHGIRGGFEGAGALGADIITPLVRGFEALEPVGRGITNAAYTASTGDSAPIVSPPAAPQTLRPTTPAPPATPQTLRPAQDATMPGQDPGRITLRGRAGADVAGAPGVSKFTEKGRTLYTNVAGDNADMMDKKLVGIVPGMDPELIKSTLRNPDGSTWSAQDNAIMAANQRDGIDPYIGTSREQKAAPVSDTARRLRSALDAYADPKREIGTGKALRSQIAALTQLQQDETSRSNNAATNATTLRGQDMDYQGKLAGAQTAAATLRHSVAKDAQAQANADRTFRVESTNKARDDKRAGEDAFDKRVAGMAGVDKDGKPDLATASAVRNTVSAFLAEKQAAAQAALKRDPNNAQAAAILRDIVENGLGGVDEETLREILLGQRANSVARKGAGWSPWGGTATNTDAPVRSLKLRESWLPGADKYVADNGQVLMASDVKDNPDLAKFIGARTK